jgi:hypothetical protein
MATTAKKERKSLMTPIGRACFVHLFEPYAMKEDKAKQYSITLSFDAEAVASKELKNLKQACIAAAMAKFGKTEDEVKKLVKAGRLKMPWRDNAEYEEYGAPFNEPGLFCAFKTSGDGQPPQIVDKSATPVMDRNKVYSGMFARVTYSPWGYDSNGNKGVTLILNNVQKTAEGERLAGRPDATDEFDAVDGGDDSTDGDDDDVL